MNDDATLMIAVRVKEACIKAAKVGYEDAAILGLCHEGAVEASISAIQTIDVDAIMRELTAKD
ncbi:acetyltransferase [Salinicola corii]|uniref:acetyltransferase n=1 Tax=Salinicola corii TaxID=2606937 RepID=UPI001658E7E1|nr:acetyltransferase [Salinicola corii]